jgi:tetratricopeptide (TPR) repeat protein
MSPYADKTWSRDLLITLLNTALGVGEYKYARQVAIMWLSVYPGDLLVRLLHARALLEETNPSLQEQALQILEEICLYDPEFVEAQKTLSKAQRYLKPDSDGTASNCVLALGGSALRHAHGTNQPPSWVVQLRETRRLMVDDKKGESAKAVTDLEQAEKLIHQVLAANPNIPLAAVTHLRVTQALGTMPNVIVLDLAKGYLERWPKCLPIMLFVAQTSLDSADSSIGVSLLHRAVALDITGQVPRRLWGENHPYRSLWPDELVIQPGGSNSPQNIHIPAQVATVYGWNQIPDHIDHPKDNPLPPIENQTENSNSELKRAIPTQDKSNLNQGAQKPFLSRIHSRATNNLNHDGRFPIYVVFSTRTGLEQYYMPKNYPLIKDAMMHLVNAVRGRRIGHQIWGSMLFLADDPSTCAALDINPARHNDPWSLKLALADLDNALGKRGERVGALIIIGGHEVVPFHHLPNPVEDIDRDVPSDNPYGTRDENYFVLEWPVGRLPGGAGSDPATLINLINSITAHHQSAAHPDPWYRAWINSLLTWLNPKRRQIKLNLGYSAAVWRRASLAVFRSIGDPQSLLISPPVQACEIDPAIQYTTRTSSVSADSQFDDVTCLVLPDAQFGYFNLHGLSDTSEWYGQRDPMDAEDGPDFPIALRPQDIRNSGHAPRVVFSEACYGAYIHGKKASEAISIKFLTSGTLAVVGSTSTCYGSIASPLIAADLLGRVYWGLISEGNLAGEALRRAKLYLAREMHQRQGYLDGEDQKTLISFVLYGDPLAQPYPITRHHKLIKTAPDLPGHLLVISDQQPTPGQQSSPSPEITAHVRQVVKQYLPGMSDAQIKVNPSRDIRNISRRSTSFSTDNAKNYLDSQGRQVVILSKSIEQADIWHQQTARLTLDKSGKLVKLVVSR